MPCIRLIKRREVTVARGRTTGAAAARPPKALKFLNYTDNMSVFDKFSVFYRNPRGLNLNLYKPSVVSQNNSPLGTEHHYIDNARASLMRGCPTGVGLTHRQVSVFSGVKFITNSSRYNAQCDENLSCCPQSAHSVGRLGAVTFVNSTKRAQQFTAPSAISHDLPMTLGTTLPSLVRS